MEAFEYAHPTTQHEAIGLLGSKWNDAAVLAGGTDLISLMKVYLVTPKRVVNIKNVEGLNGIHSNAEGVTIGALVTMDELLENATIRSEFPALTQAAGGITSPQIRAMGTVGGDLCQRPPCWDFRHGYGLRAKERDGGVAIFSVGNQWRYLCVACYVVLAHSRLSATLVSGRMTG